MGPTRARCSASQSLGVKGVFWESGPSLSPSLFLHRCSDSVQLPKPNISLMLSKSLTLPSSLIFPICLSAAKSKKLVFKVKNENITSQSIHSSTLSPCPHPEQTCLSFCRFSFLIHTTINLFLDTVISGTYLFSNLFTEAHRRTESNPNSPSPSPALAQLPTPAPVAAAPQRCR